MIYLGKNICSIIIFKGIFVGYSYNFYCGLVKIGKKVENVYNFFVCDFLFMGDKCGVYIFFYLEV